MPVSTRTPGPKPRGDDSTEKNLVADYLKNEMTVMEVCVKYGYSKQGLYNVLDRHGVSRGRTAPDQQGDAA